MATTAHELFMRWVRDTPDQPAVDSDDGGVTYRELGDAVHSLSQRLIDLGIGRGSVVAVSMSPSIGWVCAFGALMKIGAIYVPVDSALPAERIAFILSDSTPDLLMVDERTNGMVRAAPHLLRELVNDTGSSPFRELPAHRRELGRARRVREPSQPHPDDIAYQIYTSGTTGVPKGVLVAHSGLPAMASSIRRLLAVGSGARVLQAASHGFDAAIWELGMALFCGATLVVRERDDLQPGKPLQRTIEEVRPTHITLPPSVLAVLDDQALTSVECLVVAGEPVSSTLVDTFSIGRRMHNAYGPTETTVCATISEPLDGGQLPSVGTAVDEAHIVVLDSQLRKVDHGIGEMYIAGPGLAKGYHGQRGLTASRFVPNPWGRPGARLYRTGDLVAVSENGALYYRGRSDDQVKINGVRVELQEVEQVVATHPMVGLSAVVKHSENGRSRLVSYVVPRSRIERHQGSNTDDLNLVVDVSSAELRRYASKLLHPAMVPTEFVFLDRMPLTPNGKLDKSSLPAPRIMEVPYRSPSNELETTLIAHVEKVLGRTRVGVDDDFFASGGDSISSIRLVSRVRSDQIRINARDVFENRTVAELARVAARTGEEAVTLRHARHGAFDAAPVAHWFVERGPGLEKFCQVLVLDLPITVTEERLRAVLDEILDVHTDLARTRIDGTVMSVAETDTARREFFDRHSVSSTADREAILHHVVDHFVTGLDPSRTPLLGFVWIDGPRPQLVIVVHHAIIDAVSWQILLGDLVLAWEAFRKGEKPRLAPATTPARSWLLAAKEYATASSCTAQLPLWLSMTKGPDPLIGRRGLLPAVDTVATVERREAVLDVESTRMLTNTFPARYSATIEEVLLAALAVTVVGRTGDRSADEQYCIIRVEGHGRQEQIVPGADLSRTVGWFTTIHPLRVDLTGIDPDEASRGGITGLQVIAAVKNSLRSIPDNGIGYGLLKHQNPEVGSSLRSRPLGRVGFNFLGRVPTDLGSGLRRVDTTAWTSLDHAGIPAMPATAELDMNVRLVDADSGERLHAELTAPQGIFDDIELERVEREWSRTLRAMVRSAAASTDRGIDVAELTAPMERAELDEILVKHPNLIDVWPPTSLQQGLLFHRPTAAELVDPYQVQYCVHLRGSLDPERMHRAAERLVDRHAALRSAFMETSGGLRQVIVDKVAVPWTYIELNSGNTDSRLNAVNHYLAADLREHFDLHQAPLLRFALLKRGESTNELVLTAHHAIFDGWSFPVLIENLLALYAEQPVEPPPDPTAFHRWYLSRSVSDTDAAWRFELDGVDSPTLLSAERPPLVRGDFGKVQVPVEPATMPAIAALAASLSVTVNTVVQAAWAILLAAMKGRSDVVFGAVVSGRSPDVEAVEDLVGMMLNTVAVRVRLDPNRTCVEVIENLQRRQAALQEFHHLGLIDAHRLAGQETLFDTIIGYESFPLNRDRIAQVAAHGDLVVTGLASHTVSHYPIAVMVFADGELAPRITLQYNDRQDPETVNDLANRFGYVLNAMSSDPARRLSAISVLHTAERQWMADCTSEAGAERIDQLHAAMKSGAVFTSRHPNEAPAPMGACVLGEVGAPVPMGEVGEIHLNYRPGTDVASSHTNLNPFDPAGPAVNGTGVRARWTAPGVLDCLPVDRSVSRSKVDADRTTYRAPRTDIERVFCEIFAEILGVTDVGIDDDFYDLGGNSLSATRIASRIRTTMNREVTVQMVFRSHTPAGLALAMSAAKSTNRPQLRRMQRSFDS